MVRPRSTTRAQIDEIAISLFLEHGYTQVRVSDIVEACGISRPTFFRYVTSKDDIILDVIRVVNHDMARRLASAPGHGWAALVDAFCAEVDSIDPHGLVGKAHRVLQNNADIRALALAESRDWRGLLADALLGRGEFGADPFRCELAATMVIGIAHMSWTQITSEPVSLRDAFDRLPSVLLSSG